MKIFYVFGESQNDTGAIAELIRARAEADKVDASAVLLRAPLIHQKSGSPRTRKSNAEKIASTVSARRIVKKERQVVVVAHEDCDAVEPAHHDVARKIESGLKSIGFPVVAAAPAFEMEAWWYLWPTAVASVCAAWTALGRKNTNVGLISNAKETLARELRPAGKRYREYRESDAPAIAKRVRAMKLIDMKSATSDSYNEFEAKIKKCLK